MKERPILFIAPMVRALLAGTKTQTRRVFKQAKGLSLSVGIPDETPGVAELSWLWGDGPGYDVNETIKRVPCPYGQPGDRLWVREAFRFPESINHLSPAEIGEKALAVGYPKPWCPIQFEADGLRRTPQEWRDFVTPPQANEAGRLRAGMHMPRWASRITLEVTGVRVERLQDISDADAQAEGADPRQPATAGGIYIPGQYRLGFFDLWKSINGPKSWAANPWVWVVEFKRMEQPA